MARGPDAGGGDGNDTLLFLAIALIGILLLWWFQGALIIRSGGFRGR